MRPLLSSVDASSTECAIVFVAPIRCIALLSRLDSANCSLLTRRALSATACSDEMLHEHDGSIVTEPVGRGGDRRSARARIENAQRAERALRLHIAGMPVHKIAEQLGMTADATKTLISRQIKRLPATAAEELRKVQDERLNLLFASAVTSINRGDGAPAISAGARVIAEQNRLHGLDQSQSDDSAVVEFTTNLTLWRGGMSRDLALEDTVLALVKHVAALTAALTAAGVDAPAGPILSDDEVPVLVADRPGDQLTESTDSPDERKHAPS